ncbi:MAG: DNA polymerase III subunit delta [Bacteroidaceae bacterium]|nr:DNA polymerase III subunit delta [Bacteroidaceae bacterium]
MPPASSSRKSATSAGVTPESILSDVQRGDIKPVYLLMGVENFYLDRLESQLVDALVPEGMRDWAMITLFGAETDVETVVTTARAFPMGGDRMVVVLKEAQNLEDFARLETYLKQPQPTTVLIITYRGGTVDKRWKAYTLIKKIGVVYETPRIYENKLPTFVANFCTEKGLKISREAAALMAEHNGADLSRIATEIEKLAVALPEGQTTIGIDLVAEHIGISKSFNVFELTDALGEKNVKKAFQIAKYFDNNPKANPIQRTLPVLFRYFSNLFLAKYAPDQTPRTLANYLGMSEWQADRTIVPALRNYTAKKLMQIITAIRRTDARSKGIDNPVTPDGELLRELLFYILH